MTHHWRPSDLLERSFIPGQWFLFDRGRLVGVVQMGRINGRWGFRGLSPEPVPEQRRTLGYAWSIEDAADRLWEWHVRSSGSGVASGGPRGGTIETAIGR